MAVHVGNRGGAGGGRGEWRVRGADQLDAGQAQRVFLGPVALAAELDGEDLDCGVGEVVDAQLVEGGDVDAFAAHGSLGHAAVGSESEVVQKIQVYWG